MEREIVYGQGMRTAGYDQERGYMEIEWEMGLWRYWVPLIVFEQFMETHEKTRYFNERIRKRYPEERVK